MKHAFYIKNALVSAEVVLQLGIEYFSNLPYNMLNKESVSQGKAGHPVFELQFIKNGVSTC